MNIILIGYMGCGKSTVGYRLSYRLKKTLLDTDKLVEQKAGCTIREIFAQKGEAAFREMEKKTLIELIAKETSNQIIATGGGLPVQPGNGELLKQLGCVIWLKVGAETVYERLKDDTTRPLLQGDNPKQKIESMLEQRNPLYEACADVIVEVDGKSFDDIIKEIVNKIP